MTSAKTNQSIQLFEEVNTRHLEIWIVPCIMTCSNRALVAPLKFTVCSIFDISGFSISSTAGIGNQTFLKTTWVKCGKQRVAFFNHNVAAFSTTRLHSAHHSWLSDGSL